MYCATQKYPEGDFAVFSIDIPTLTVIDSIISPAVFSAGAYYDLFVNSEGSKVLSAGDWLSAEYLHFDFNTMQYHTIPASGMKVNTQKLKLMSLIMLL